jgi:hypothetical protein
MHSRGIHSVGVHRTGMPDLDMPDVDMPGVFVHKTHHFFSGKEINILYLFKKKCLIDSYIMLLSPFLQI